MSKKLTNIGFTDNFAVLSWHDLSVDYVILKTLRLACPCAFCSGEKDVLGNVYKGKGPSLSNLAFELKQYNYVGQYGVRFVWGDGHKDGIYTFAFLKQIASFNEKK